MKIVNPAKIGFLLILGSFVVLPAFGQHSPAGLAQSQCERLLWPQAKSVSEKLIYFNSKTESSADRLQAENLNSSDLVKRQAAVRYFILKSKYKDPLTPIYNAIVADHSENRIVREFAIEALVAWGSKSSIPMLEAQLNTPSIALLSALIRGLTRLEATQDLPAIRAFLEHPHATIRQAALESVTWFQDKTSISKIESLLKDSDSQVQVLAIQALASLNSTRSASRIAQLIEHPINRPPNKIDSRQKATRLAAIRALGELGYLEGTSTLRDLLKKKEQPEQTEAMTALGQLHDTASRSEIEAIAVSNQKNSTQAIQALGLLGSQESISLLTEIANKDSSPQASIAADVLASSFGKLPFHRLYRALKNDRLFFESNGNEIPIREFTKTGSRTFLLGGKLAGKVILRFLPENQLQLWSNARSHSETWTQAGFNYTPIEPIFNLTEIGDRFQLDSNQQQSIQKWIQSIASESKKEKFVPAFALVLGPTLDVYAKMVNSSARSSLERDRRKIIDTMRWNLQLNHGHPHDQNFCVETVGGEAKLYLIDFDQITTF